MRVEVRARARIRAKLTGSTVTTVTYRRRRDGFHT